MNVTCQCGAPPAPGRKRCARCLERVREATRRRYYAARGLPLPETKKPYRASFASAEKESAALIDAQLTRCRCGALIWSDGRGGHECADEIAALRLPHLATAKVRYVMEGVAEPSDVERLRRIRRESAARSKARRQEAR